MAGNCNREAQKSDLASYDFAASLNSARTMYSKGMYNKAFDIYEQLVESFPVKSIDLLAEVYDCYKLISDHDRYRLYQARRFNFNLSSTDKVLDIGSGHAPFPLATHLAELAVDDSNYGRAGLPFKYVNGKELFICNAEDMPFKNHEFDFVYCSHVLEHVNNPEKACEELMRIAKRGYIETPTRAKDLWLNTAKVSKHRWSVDCECDKLVFTEYTPGDLDGLQCDILLSMHCDPKTDREKTFAALIYLKPEKFNTMFMWEDRFYYKVKRNLNCDVKTTMHSECEDRCDREARIQVKDDLPSLAAALNEEGEKLFLKGDIDEAWRRFRKAVRMDQGLAAAWNNMGVACWQAGDTERSLKYFASAMKIDPYDRDTNINLCRIFAALERHDEAEKICRSYLKTCPGDEEILCFQEEMNLRSSVTRGEKYNKRAVSAAEVRDAVKERKLRFLQVNTFYKKYLDDFIARTTGFSQKTFNEQVDSILTDGFSAIHNYTNSMRSLGYESQFIIANCITAQYRWLHEKGLTIAPGSDWVTEITRKQIEDYKPDVLFLSNSFLFDNGFLKKLMIKPRLVLGWTGEPVPDGVDWSGFDAILSNFSYSRLKALENGAKGTEDFYPGFQKWLAEQAGGQSPEYDVVFVGQWSELHQQRNRIIAVLAGEAKKPGGFSLGLFLFGDINNMPPEVREFCCGERFGIEMHKAFRSGKIAINAGILPQSGNMRLFETTGTGVFLLTEYQMNISEYFKPGEEIETFRDDKELIDKIRYFLKHTDEREAIARRGQDRCLRDHSMSGRASVLDNIIRNHLKLKSGAGRRTEPNRRMVPGGKSERQSAAGQVGKVNSPIIEKIVRELNDHHDMEALKDIEKVMTDSPAMHGLNYVKAIALARLGRMEEAIESLKYFVSQVPEHRKAGILLEEIVKELIHNMKDEAANALKNNKYNEASSLLNKAKSFRQPVKDIDYFRALCFQKTGQTLAVKEALQEELRYYPDNEKAAALLNQVISKHPQITTSKIRDEEFQELFKLISPYTMLSDKRLYSLFAMAKNVCKKDLPGSFVECGVAAGGSTALLASVIKRYSKQSRVIYAFDSFEGMPEPTGEDKHDVLAADAIGWGTGTCAAPIESVMNICRQLGVSDIVIPVKGRFEHTLPVRKHIVGPIAVLHMDGDWYESTKTILSHLYDLVVDHGFVQVDDYGFWEGCRQAVQEFETHRNVKLQLNKIDSTGVWFAKNGNLIEYETETA